ncbi:MAG TPA: GNAT family N-acetyltransferase [Gemmatimonadaceae bacterium]
MSVSIRQLGPEDAAVFQAIRLQGLRECPQAFGSTYAEDLVLSLDTIAQRLTPSRSPVGRVVFGAFAGEALVGFAGCMQEGKVKSRHKAIVWGTYVAPAHRGEGAARRLLEHIIAEAGSWPDVERLILTVIERAEAARRLYRAVGFEVFAREPDALRQDGISDAVEYMALSLRREGASDSPARR